MAISFTEKISIVTPVYNTDVSILNEAVESMLNQTFREFEFIIVDDCSGEETQAYLRSLKDPRIRLIRNETNLGVTKSLNVGLRAARGKYIARMDADDISLPMRLEKQYAFMEAHPEVIVCGTRAEFFGAKQGATDPVCLHGKAFMDDYRAKMLFLSPGPIHSSVIFSHELLLKHHILYDESLIYAQDYGMWVTVSHYGQVYKMNEILLRYRIHGNQISIAHMQKQAQCDQMIKRRLLTELLGDVTDEEVKLHYIYANDKEIAISPEVKIWCRRLLDANRKKGIYNQQRLKWYTIFIKRRLIEQTCAADPSFFKKAALFFRYLPFAAAVRATGKTAQLKLTGK